MYFISNARRKQIASSVKISKGVVAKYVSLAAASGFDRPTICSLEETAPEQRSFVPCGHRNMEARYGRIYHKMYRKGVKLMLLWEKY